MFWPSTFTQKHLVCCSWLWVWLLDLSRVSTTCKTIDFLHIVKWTITVKVNKEIKEHNAHEHLWSFMYFTLTIWAFPVNKQIIVSTKRTFFLGYNILSKINMSLGMFYLGMSTWLCKLNKNKFQLMILRKDCQWGNLLSTLLRTDFHESSLSQLVLI